MEVEIWISRRQCDGEIETMGLKLFQKVPVIKHFGIGKEGTAVEAAAMLGVVRNASSTWFVLSRVC
jgi:hypothetical protein